MRFFHWISMKFDLELPELSDHTGWKPVFHRLYYAKETGYMCKSVYLVFK